MNNSSKIQVIKPLLNLTIHNFYPKTDLILPTTGFKSVYPKCHFVVLLNWKLKFEILISEFRFYTKFEK